MTRPLKVLRKPEKAFWTRVWKGDKDALHILSLTLFLGVMFYFVLPHVYESVLNALVADILQKLP